MLQEKPKKNKEINRKHSPNGYSYTLSCLAIFLSDKERHFRTFPNDEIKMIQSFFDALNTM